MDDPVEKAAEAEKATAVDAAAVAEVVMAQAVCLLPPNWIRVYNSAHKRNPKNEPPFYFSNTVTGQTSWVAPPPPKNLDDVDATPVDLTNPNKEREGTLNDHFAAPPRQSYEDAIAGRSEDESSDDDEMEEDEAEKTPAQLTFTTDEPEKLYMRPIEGQKGLIDAARKIGVYEDGMLKAAIETAIMKYFVNLHGGSVESYLNSDCFRPEMQDIDRKRKASTHSERKKVFAREAAASGNKKSKTSRDHKKYLGGNKVRT